uniref:cAMP-dependent protein kinase inhibitor beta n=1 Tax=Bos taurus TaxID=9913 RepID=A0A3Q1MZC8_BOVIN
THLDNPGGQESTSNCSKGRDSTGNQQDVTMRTDSPKMTDVEPVVNNFASSARAGRRNAVPDIQGSTAAGGTLEELPVKLEALSVKEDVKKKDEETAQDQLEKPKDEGK